MRLIGHRGAAHEAPENTVTGFRYAMSKGVTSFEFDVRLTRDGHLVVIHDATVDRTTDGAGPVADFSLAELQALRAFGRFEEWPEEARIPTFQEVIDVVSSAPYLEIEIKPDTEERIDQVVPALIDALYANEMLDRVVVTSFQGYPLRLARKRAPDLRLGINGISTTPEHQQLIADIKPVQGAIGVTPTSAELIRRLHEQNIRVTIWSANDPQTFADVISWDVDCIGSDRPGFARTWLTDHGYAFDS